MLLIWWLKQVFSPFVVNPECPWSTNSPSMFQHYSWSESPPDLQFRGILRHSWAALGNNVNVDHLPVRASLIPVSWTGVAGPSTPVPSLSASVSMQCVLRGVTPSLYPPLPARSLLPVSPHTTLPAAFYQYCALCSGNLYSRPMYSFGRLCLVTWNYYKQATFNFFYSLWKLVCDLCYDLK